MNNIFQSKKYIIDKMYSYCHTHESEKVKIPNCKEVDNEKYKQINYSDLIVGKLYFITITDHSCVTKTQYIHIGKLTDNKSKQNKTLLKFKLLETSTQKYDTHPLFKDWTRNYDDLYIEEEKLTRDKNSKYDSNIEYTFNKVNDQLNDFLKKCHPHVLQ